MTPKQIAEKIWRDYHPIQSHMQAAVELALTDAHRNDEARDRRIHDLEEALGSAVLTIGRLRTRIDELQSNHGMMATALEFYLERDEMELREQQ